MLKYLILALFYPSLLLADQFNVIWEPVTLDANSNQLNELPNYKLYISTSPIKSAWPLQITPELTTQDTKATFTRTKVGKYYVVVTASTSAGESGPSNEIFVEVKPVIPQIPANLKVIN